MLSDEWAKEATVLERKQREMPVQERVHTEAQN